MNICFDTRQKNLKITNHRQKTVVPPKDFAYFGRARNFLPKIEFWLSRSTHILRQNEHFLDAEQKKIRLIAQKPSCRRRFCHILEFYDFKSNFKVFDIVFVCHHQVGARLDHIACCIRRGDQHISQLTHLHQQHQQQQRRSTEGAMRHRDPFARPSTSNISINSSTAMHHQNGVRLSIDSAITFQNARNSNTSANTQRMSLTSFSSTPGSNASLVAPRPRRTPSFGRYGN